MMIKPTKRDAIVEAAILLLGRSGPEALSASALAEAAGVSKANVFHHFKTLDDVVLAAFERFLLDMPGMQPAARASLRDWLLTLGAETAAAIGADTGLAGAYMGFVMRARSNEQLRHRVAAIAAGAEAQFEKALDLLAPGRFSADERKVLANLILLTGDGLALHRQLFPERAAEQSRAWIAFVNSVAPEQE